MANEHEQVMAMLGEVLRRLDQMTAPLEAPLSRSAFAKLVHKSPRTVTRWIEQKKVRTEKGLIPASEARKFLS